MPLVGSVWLSSQGRVGHDAHGRRMNVQQRVSPKEMPTCALPDGLQQGPDKNCTKTMAIEHKSQKYKGRSGYEE